MWWDIMIYIPLCLDTCVCIYIYVLHFLWNQNLKIKPPTSEEAVAGQLRVQGVLGTGQLGIFGSSGMVKPKGFYKIKNNCRNGHASYKLTYNPHLSIDIYDIYQSTYL